MLTQLRAGLTAALVILSPYFAGAADKSYHRDDLAEAAIRLEGQIKGDAGSVTKPMAALRREADAAFARNDQRAAIQSLGQIVAMAPGDAANWLRLARTILQITPVDIKPFDARERAALRERATTAAYIAYERAGNRGEEADALVVLGRSFAERSMWRPALDVMRLSLELR